MGLVGQAVVLSNPYWQGCLTARESSEEAFLRCVFEILYTHNAYDGPARRAAKGQRPLLLNCRATPRVCNPQANGGQVRHSVRRTIDGKLFEHRGSAFPIAVDRPVSGEIRLAPKRGRSVRPRLVHSDRISVPAYRYRSQRTQQRRVTSCSAAGPMQIAEPNSLLAASSRAAIFTASPCAV